MIEDKHRLQMAWDRGFTDELNGVSKYPYNPKTLLGLCYYQARQLGKYLKEGWPMDTENLNDE